jgi:hypothetical protein
MARGVISLGVLLVIVLVPVAAYVVRSAGHGATLRATIGRCSAAQRAQHRHACDYIDRHPTLDVVGPIDETGTPFSYALHRADDARTVRVAVDSGRYAVFLEIDHVGTVRVRAGSDIDMSTGSRDLGTIVPSDPWQFTGVPGG